MTKQATATECIQRISIVLNLESLKGLLGYLYSHKEDIRAGINDFDELLPLLDEIQNRAGDINFLANKIGAGSGD